ncbi:MAG TPA: SAM-dependent methyltransferase [Acidimicrobiia bacterium]
MAEERVSRSAQGVLFIRAQLASLGVVDDTLAREFLPTNARRPLSWLQLPGLWRLARRSSGPYLAVRTIFFDRFVEQAIATGTRQVVILAAGYDSRSWRFARPGVSFFEVDRRATQADKRRRAPAGGPVYVPADVTDERLVELLADAGLRADEPTAYVVEGLVVYLDERDVADLLARLFECCPVGSRLAVSFEDGFEDRPLTRRLMTAYYRGRETYRFRLRREDAPTFVSAAGWAVEEVAPAVDLAPTSLHDTRLSGANVRSGPFFVVATRPEHGAPG